MLRVMRNHRRAADGERAGYEKLSVAPDAARPSRSPTLARWADLTSRAAPPGTTRSRSARRTAIATRRSRSIAPTGTIGLVMDCDTTGIEPDFALVKFKKLAGGGYFKIINRAVPEALRALGYREKRDRRDRRLRGRPRLRSRKRRASTTRALRAKGFTDERSTKVEAALAGRLRHQVRLQQMDARRRLPRQDARNSRPNARRRRASISCAALGFAKAEIEAANIHVCGAMTLEGAPHLKTRALSGVRLRQPLRAHRQALSLGREPHPHDGGGAAVHLGRDLARPSTCPTTPRSRIARTPTCCPGGSALKANALYRDGSKLSQPLSARSSSRTTRRTTTRSRRWCASAPARAAAVAERIVERVVERIERTARARAAARPPQGLHAEGGGRRPQGLSAHRRISRTAGSARSSSTCTRKAPPSAR